MSTAEMNEIKLLIKGLGDELRFDIKELRQDMNYRFDEQDAIHNQILHAIGARFESNEQSLGDHSRRIIHLEGIAT